ncbi:MAG: hypothetical protein U0457_16990 [Candidatus Sericytochromatia bacterium]
MSIFFKIEYFNPIAFLYELYKFSVFFFFFPLTLLSPKVTLNVAKKFLPILLFLLFFNLLATIAQHIFGGKILITLGIKANIFVGQIIGHSQKTGLLPGKNISGAVNLYSFILTLIILKYKSIFDIYKINISNINLRALQIINLLGIVLSESKNSIISLLIVIFIYWNIKNRYKFTIISTSFISIIVYMYSLNIFRLKDKILSYVILAQNYQSFLNNIGSIYGKGVEERGIELVKGIILIINNFPLGLGFGTWGDASASYNTAVKGKLVLYTDLSDSYLSHLFVEQGFLAFLYFFIIYLLIKNHGKVGFSIFFALIVFEGSTMGRSSAIAPLIIAFIFALLLVIEREKETKLDNNQKII